MDVKSVMIVLTSQILGFDILLKEDGRPVLLELNANPSLRIDFEAEVSPGIFQSFYSQVDEKIKKALVLDTLLLVVPTKGLALFAIFKFTSYYYYIFYPLIKQCLIALSFSKMTLS